MTGYAPEESTVALALDRYQGEIVDQARLLLTDADFLGDGEDMIVDILPFEVEPRTDALISNFLRESKIPRDTERTDETVEEIFRRGLQLHALVSALGESGVRLALLDDQNKPQYIHFAELDGEDEVDDDSAMGQLMNTMQDDVEDDPLEVARVQHLGMFAITSAILSFERQLTEMTDEVILNRGAQMYCLLAGAQGTGSRISFVDRDGNAITIADSFSDEMRKFHLLTGEEA